MKKSFFPGRMNRFPVLLLAGFSFLLTFCQQKESDYATLYGKVTADPAFLKYIHTSDEMSVLIASDKFNFAPGIRGSEVAKALQDASNNMERVAYLKKIGCTGDIGGYIQLQSDNIDSKLQIMKNHPEAKPSELFQICTDYRNKQTDKPDIVNIAKTALDEKSGKK